MKINKKGEIKLSKNEHKVVNFIIKEEDTFFKIFTANAPADMPMWSIRFRKDMFVARFIRQCLDNYNDENYIRILHNWLAVIYNATCVVPEYEFLKEINDSATKSVRSHPALYGLRPEQLSNEEDNDILEEEKEKVELIDKIDADGGSQSN